MSQGVIEATGAGPSGTAHRRQVGVEPRHVDQSTGGRIVDEVFEHISFNAAGNVDQCPDR